MGNVLIIVIFIFSLVLILKGGDLLVESSVWLANKTQIPSMVIGATVVAIATTFPEISVSLFSGLKGAESVAINTAIGSMICNIGMVLGISFLCMPAMVQKGTLVRKVIFFIFALVVLLVLGLDQKLTLVDAIILSIVFLIFIVNNLLEAKKSPEGLEFKLDYVPSWGKIILQFLVSAFSIGYGANIIVSNVEMLSKVLGLSEGLIGLFIISIGTNIPELVTTMTSIKLKNTEIGIGNIFGSSIIDATLLIAITIFSSKNKAVDLPIVLLLLTIPTLIIATMVIVLPILKKGKSSRLQGVILIILFVIYSLILAKIN